MTTLNCPICGKPTAPAYHPFCSRRCQLVDLGHWLGGNYKIPDTESDRDWSKEAED